MSFEFKIFPIVNSQNLDSAAQPTFGNIDIGSGTGAQSTVLLRSNTTAPIVGNRFKSTVEVKTNSVLVDEVIIVVQFDQTRLSVVDQDTNNSGIQIRLLSSLFEVEDVAIDNAVQTGGRIRLRAIAKDNTPVAINADFVEIEFQALTAGSTQIIVGTGVEGTSVARQNGTKLPFQSNSVTLNITTSSSTNVTTGSNNTTGNNSGNQVTSTTGTTSVAGVDTIPDTAIDSPAGLMVVFSGILLIITGIKLWFDGGRSKSGKTD